MLGCLFFVLFKKNYYYYSHVRIWDLHARYVRFRRNPVRKKEPERVSSSVRWGITLIRESKRASGGERRKRRRRRRKENHGEGEQERHRRDFLSENVTLRGKSAFRFDHTLICSRALIYFYFFAPLIISPGRKTQQKTEGTKKKRGNGKEERSCSRRQRENFNTIRLLAVVKSWQSRIKKRLCVRIAAVSGVFFARLTENGLLKGGKKDKADN